MARSRVIFIGLCLVLLVLIIWRYQAVELRIKNHELREYNDSDEEIILIGKVVKEPDVRENNVKLTIEVRTIEARLSKESQASEKDRVSKKAQDSKVLITVSRYPEYKYGDELEIRGKLETPAVFDDFDYKNYLKKDGIYSVIYYPKVEIRRDRVSTVFGKILDFKDKFRQGIYKAISPPQSEILGAMILGDKNRMSYNLKEKLNIAGVRHVTAVSGMHVLILSSILMSLMLMLGFWKNQAFYISIIIIWLFVIMTGFRSSGIRAVIMGSLFLIGQKIGRKSFSSRSIIIAGGIMLVINPMLLFYDLGFQLSFLAALGIICLAPSFKRWLKFIADKHLNFRGIIVMTLSAYIFTLPILIYNFGRISLVGILTNVLIIPVVYSLMLLGFIFVLVSLFWSGLAWLLSIPVWFLLTYIIKIVDFFSQPWAAKTIKNVHWIWPVLFYLFLAIFVWHLKRREKTKLDFSKYA